MMKIGFSSLVCPAWDLEKMVLSAAEMGYNGVELRGVQGELHLPLVPQVASHPDLVRRLFEDNNIELVCLATSATLDSKQRHEVARQKEVITEYFDLAAQLGCPFVRIFVGEVQRRDHHRGALGRIAEALRSMAQAAARRHVTLLVENGGDFCSSEDLWFLIDAAQHPALRCCWNQCHAMTAGERPTNSIPRLGHKISLVHLCDAEFDETGVLLEYKPPGQGQSHIARQIELLKGIIYDGYLVFEWPKLWVDTLAAPESVLPETAAYLRQRLDEKQAVLSAYKGDKHPPKLASLGQGSARP